MSQPESKLSGRIIKELNRQPFVCVWKNHGGPHMVAGLPDICGSVYGRFFSLEVKMPAMRSNVSKAQVYMHKLIAESGGFVTVVCSVDEALDAIRRCIARDLSVMGETTDDD